eukprot:1146522-Pelagomonas_calceolata.AAC.9
MAGQVGIKLLVSLLTYAGSTGVVLNRAKLTLTGVPQNTWMEDARMYIANCKEPFYSHLNKCHVLWTNSPLERFRCKPQLCAPARLHRQQPADHKVAACEEGPAL